MKYLAIVALVSTCLASNVDYVVNIVTEIKKHFRVDCVNLLYDEDNEMQQYTTSKKITNLFVKIRLSQAISLTPVCFDCLERLRCQRNKPLYVFTFNSQIVKRFLAQISEKFRMSEAIWLLFLDKELQLETFFTGINIPFDCEFLVVEKKDKVAALTEVYRVNKSLPLQTYRFGTWNTFVGLTSPSFSFYNRRNNLQGLDLKTGFIHSSVPKGDGKAYEKHGPTGFLGELWSLLEEEMNFTTDYHYPADHIAGAMKTSSNGSWTGVLGMLQRKKVDVTNIVFSMVSHRMNVIDYTVPVIDIRTYVIIKMPRKYSFRWNMLMSFTSQLWMAVGFTALLLSITITLVYFLRRRFELNEFDDYNFSKAVFLVICAFCQTAPSNSPKSASLRIMFLTLYAASVFLMASYSAAFTADLTLQDPVLPFTDFREFLQDGSYQLGMMPKSAHIDYFKYTKVKLLKDIYKKLVAPHESSFSNSDVEGLQRLCHKNKYAHLTSTYNLMKKGYLPSCRISLIPQAYFPGFVAIIIAKESPYKGLFNYKLQTMRRVGILKAVKYRFALRLDKKHHNKLFVTLHDTTPIFIILSTGILVSLLIFVLQLCVS